MTVLITRQAYSCLAVGCANGDLTGVWNFAIRMRLVLLYRQFIFSPLGLLRFSPDRNFCDAHGENSKCV